MNFNELSTYNLADAVKFHNRLNPGLWDADEHLRPEVQAKLLEIAADFQEFLGVSDLEVEDITISGSNAAYSYTPHSDIDLHLVVRKPESHDEVYQELFNAKKYQYNDEHDIRIRGADVELYVQDADETPVSLGEYSIKNNEWIQVPRRKRAKIDQNLVRHKYEDLRERIKSALAADDAGRISSLIAKIKTMRQAGLDAHGEFGPENLAFKILRTQGLLTQLYTARANARDRELSLKELQTPRKSVRYGFSESPNGVSPETKMFLSEVDSENVVRDFIAQTAKKLNIRRVPKVNLHRDDGWSQENNSFGRFEPDTNELHVSLNDRHLLDILRTTAHELAHCRQNELSPLPDHAGETGSKWENQANAMAGVIMRDWADAHPDHFESSQIEESSGYIPTAAQKNDPRFKMALSVDVHPGQTGKEANKMGLQTDAQGKPALLIKSLKNALREFKEGANMPQMSQGPGKYRDLNEPLGPETPPTMPAGTVKVDVSDVYDWYKLGQHISNMKGLGKHDFGAGPPSAILSFGDEETEHKYIKDLEKTGLTTTDIDPVDPKQPKGIPRQKTDPTYNVDEQDMVESLRQEFALLEDEYLSEIKMTAGNLRQLAAQTGAQAGMEFEMIVPNTEVDVEPEYEPDWDQDQRARSFSDVRDFFHDGDYNGRRAVDDLISELAGEYEEWMQEQTAEQWNRDGVDYIRDFVEVNDLFDRDEAMAQARDEVISANPDLPQESEDFSQLLSARLDALQEQFVIEAFEDQGRIYNDAFEAFAEEQRDEYDERSFLDDKYQTMSDIQSNFDISWPYYYDINDGQDGEMDIDQVADEFSSYMGKPVNASRQYHGGRREAGTYVVEPDGSLEGDNPGDGGLEFVSPPMPIDEMISDLNKVKAWADKTGCYTNESTGLHINISVPNYSLEKLDYVKLALLMGDEYILELFDRTGNHYAKSAVGKIKGMLQKNPDLAPQVMDKMREHMEDLATKAIHTGTTDKYTSINTKSGYIEFRSPGGDWLDANFSKIENTLLRFTVALSAAIDPQAYRQEYLKKLYKLLEGSQEKGGVDIVQLFSNYSAGELDKAALIRQVREKQLARDLDKGRTTPGQKFWWKVTNPANTMASIEVVAAGKEEAIAKAIEPSNYPDWARVQNTLRATPLRPYQEPDAKAAAQPSGPTLNGRPSNPNGNWVIVDRQAPRTPVYRFMAAGDNDALTVLRQWVVANPGGEWNFAPDANQSLGQPAAPQQSAQTGNWGIWMQSANRFARAPGQIDNSVLRRFPGRDSALQWIEQARRGNPNMRSDIEVREIEPSVQNTGSTTSGNWGVWIPSLDRYATIGNAGPRRFADQAGAQAWIDDYNQRHPGNDLEIQTREIEPASQAIPGSTLDLQRQRAAAAPVNRNTLMPTGPGPWEVFRISDGSSVAELGQTNRMSAEVEARGVIDQRREAPDLYGVRTRADADAAQGGTVDVATDRAAPQTLTRPGQPQQTFTGEWKVVDSQGRIIYSFSGVGNNQGDANRVAMDWLRRNPRHMQAGVEVLPIMG